VIGIEITIEKERDMIGIIDINVTIEIVKEKEVVIEIVIEIIPDTKDVDKDQSLILIPDLHLEVAITEEIKERTDNVNKEEDVQEADYLIVH
jgi:hypothetical protein